jgi:GntR family transcriptional regulator, transcriptional repressor for pyruvate dehydrogenase complex
MRPEGQEAQPELASRLKRRPKPRVYEQIVRQIRDMIHTGKLAPGDRLLPERQLSETLGVSRTAVREALSKLASIGLIEVKPGGGAWVKQVTLDAVIEPLAAILLKEREAVAQLMELRSILESKAVLIAAQRATPPDVARLKWCAYRVIEDIRAGQDATESDIEFHLSIAKATHNELLVSITAMMSGLLREAYGPLRERMLQGPNAATYGEQHLGISEAIAAGRGQEGEELLCAHLDLARQEMAKFFKDGLPEMWNEGRHTRQRRRPGRRDAAP